MTGCGGGGESGGHRGSSAVQQSSGDSGEKMLKVATHWEKATFDPALWGDGGSVKAGISIFETLLALDEDRKPDSEPGGELGCIRRQKNIYLSSEERCRFHAGYGELTSEDVAYTLGAPE